MAFHSEMRMEGAPSPYLEPMMEMLRRAGLTLVGCALLHACWAARILVPMDDSQTNHLKAYGVAFWVSENGVEV